jgi:Raf kinase inhibitor-like YbhB/YbcL family protein
LSLAYERIVVMTGRLRFAAVAMLWVLVPMGGCGRQGQAEPVQPVAPGQQREAKKVVWVLSSSAFKDGARIPRKYTCDGEDVSPPLSWTAPPAKTTELALICDDPDAPRGTFTHWVLYTLPASTASLPENVAKTETLPKLGGAKQGKNSAGGIGYMGPCPPSGPAHHYHFIVYALDAKLDLRAGATQKDLRKAMEGHVAGQTELVGLYGR